MRISDWSSDVCSSDLCCLVLLLTSCATERHKPISAQLKQQFKAADKNTDEALDRDEFNNFSLPDAKFEQLDTDNNGKVTLAEVKNYVIWRRVQDEGRRRYDETRRNVDENTMPARERPEERGVGKGGDRQRRTRGWG